MGLPRDANRHAHLFTDKARKASGRAWWSGEARRAGDRLAEEQAPPPARERARTCPDCDARRVHAPTRLCDEPDDDNNGGE